MNSRSWKIDEGNQVTFNQGILGKFQLTLNGKKIAERFLWRKTTVPFSLEDGRNIELLITQSAFVPELSLRVAGQLILSDVELKTVSCLKCGGHAEVLGKFCEKCGAELPGAETQQRMKHLRDARNAIAWVAGMFLIFGVAMFFFQKHNVDISLKNLAHLPDSSIYPTLISGKQYTVGELKSDLRGQPMSVLATNVILALIMFGLYIFGKKSPLAAILVATGVYASVQVANAIIEPTSIGQGLVLKVIMFALLIKGIRSALELRKINA